MSRYMRDDESRALLASLISRARVATDDAERLAIIRQAWDDDNIDWDYDSRLLLRAIWPE